ncbi:cold-shock protein [Azospirillum sp.]|uniref:cold-shock protein n=1 Tax=Azospirillum sp. TaxID=34012 RepID=UPI002D3C9F21|nr:cold shock domain-containing protein [Azospirillum sp.]HYD67205.1 cold shock domain-containing protein [Azospirillum sp.]
MFDRPQRNAFRAPEITHRNIRATVKWFNPTKGFGFVTPEDGSPDAFLHSTVLQFSGHDALADGTTIVCDLSRGPKGPQVANIHSVDTSTAAPGRPQRAPRDSGGWGDHGGGATETVEGTVKWFNVTKGFGFIAPVSGGKDIFVHIRALEKSGLDGLADGEQVRVTVRQGAKGPEAERVEVV